VRNNIIENVPGYGSGTAPPYEDHTNAFGIYFDDGCKSMSAEGNTIIRARDAAIYSHNNGGAVIVRNNTLYKCGGAPGPAPSYLVIQSASSNPEFVFTGNIVYPPARNRPFITVLNSGRPIPASSGTIDTNCYINPYNTPYPFCSYDREWKNRTYYTFSTWRALTGQDKNSTMVRRRNFSGGGDTLVVNRTGIAMRFEPSQTEYRGADGNSISESVIIPPYSSLLLLVGRGVRN
jgi:hypothetical protein